MPVLYRNHFPGAPVALRTERDLPSALVSPEVKLRGLSRVLAARLPGAKPGVQTPSLISSYAGSIDELLFMWPRFVFDPDLRQGYGSLLAALPAGTRFVVAHPEALRADAEALLTETGHLASARLVPIPDHISFTDWAEDAFVGLIDTDDDTRYLCEPFEFLRAGDSMIADAIEESVDLEAAPSPLIFQGGNCLVGDDFWFLGFDYYLDTHQLLSGGRPPVVLPNHPDIQHEDIVDLFAKHLDKKRELILVGTSRRLPAFAIVAARDGEAFHLDYAYGGVGVAQPIFHIDMFITLVGRQPGGKFLILVGSPRMAVEVAGIPPCPYDLQSAYDEIAARLPSDRFEVVRNPLAMVHEPGRRFSLRDLKEQVAEIPDPGDRAPYEAAIRDFELLGAKDESTIESRDWYHATSNNCLVQESAAAGNHVYVPTFGHGRFAALAAVDAHMRELWAGLGFTPHMLGDFHPFARRQGVVHCIKKYVARGA